ncbi:MAG TPA: primosomal protein N' [Vicinamibacteria bacterium]|nr:primosomal protein N' [Vicinamibacteria bacterium]
MDEERLSVALPVPFQAPFTYRMPAGQPPPARGVRVLVPFGGRRMIGVVTGAAGEDEGRALKEIVQILDEEPLVEPPLLDLAAWMAEHYLAPPGECYRAVLPPAGVRASRAVVHLTKKAGDSADNPVLRQLRDGPMRLSAIERKLGRDPQALVARLRSAGLVEVEQDLTAPGFHEVTVAVLADAPVEAKGRAQAVVLERLRAAGGRARVADLVRDRPALRGAVDRLAGKGALRLVGERDVRTPDGLPAIERAPVVPTPDQEAALRPLLEALGEGTFRPFLLHGVTGSGKTEVYFRAVERALGSGRGAIVLVPEIALTPMLVRAARTRFGSTVSVLHSELSAGERHDQWWRIREGDSRLVVGARSAVFAPVPGLGLVVVDEEHDASYKQDESPRYHARDVAVMRSRLEGCPIVLGSATPSVESHANALRGKYERRLLATRIGPQGLPRVEIVDRREVLRAGGDPILSPLLRDALAGRLARGEQSLLLLNRRGYATSLLCRECGQEATCPNCSVSLTLHQGGRSALCHYCGYEATTPTACASCRGPYLRLTGFGTERVAEAVHTALPRARVERLDRDRARRRGVVAQTLAAFERGEIDVLVGTQMIAKGHDFPKVTLVGVVDADVGLGIPDFRSAERTFQLLTQVAGRAGRGEAAGEVILQSHMPDHYALGHACAQDYDSFFEREMEFRRTMGYPPVAALVNVIVRSREAAKGAQEADALSRLLRASAAGRYRVLGPAHAPLARLRNEHRFQLLLKGHRPAMRDAVKAALVARYGPQRWPGVAVDVDPLTVM